MTTILFKWKIYCNIDKQFEYIWQETSPITCPINSGHSVNLNKISKENELKAITITNIFSPYNVGKTSLLCDTTIGNITANLSKASRSKNSMILIQKTASANSVTINANGSELIDGLSSKNLTTLNEIVILLSDGTNWSSQPQRANINNNNISLSNNKGDILVDNSLEVVSLPLGTNNYLLQVDSTTDTGIKWGNSLIDSVITFSNSSDNTKKFKFDLSNITTTTTRTLTVLDANTTLVGTDTSQTLTNKTISAGSNTITGLNSTHIGLSNVQNLKVNLNASLAPGVTDDSGAGYSVGSRWIDTTSDKEYVCLDSTSSSAVWTETTSTGGSGEINTSSSAGGTSLVKTKVGIDLPFKGLTATSTKIALTSNTNDIGINVIEANIIIGNLSGAPTGTVVGTTDSQTLTNKTLTATTNNIIAKGLHSATTTVSVSAATAPTVDQALISTSSTTATWQSLGFKHYGASATDPSGSFNPGDKYYNTVLNHEMFYDASRAKWLTVATFFDGCGRNGQTNSSTFYKRFNGMNLSTTEGDYAPKGTIISISFNNNSSGNHTLEVLVDGTVIASLASGGASSAYADNINADFNAGVMSARNASGSTSTNDFQATYMYRRRL